MPGPSRDAGVVDPITETEPDHGAYRITGARVVAFALVLALVWFGGLGFRKLIKPDEGRYAEIPREMVVTGDWLTPRLNGLKYFEKPPLQYWTTAIAYEAFGISEWTSRLWTALTGFVGVLVVGYTAMRLYDRRTGLFAATVTASSLAYLLLAHFNTLDMGLTLFMTTTLCAVLLARDARMRETAPEGHCGSAGRAAPASSRNWMLVAWATLALATLSKGPVAVVLCGGAFVVYLAIARDWTLLRMLNLTRGLALFVLIAGPWFIAVSKANREFAQFFFIHEHVERFLTTEHRREGPLWYFVPVVIVGSLPWLSLLPKAIVEGWRAVPRHGFAPERLLIAYVAIVFVFFSLSGSKLPSYVLPLFPALAILLGRTLARSSRSSLTVHLSIVALVAGVVAIAALVVPLDSNDSATAIEHFRVAASISMSLWLIGTGAAILLAKRARLTTAVMTAGFAAVIGWSSLLIGHETLGRGMSSYDIAQQMKPLIAPDTTIYSVGMFEHTLDFYLQRTVTLVAFEDELEFGLAQEPERGIRDLRQFTARWNADRAPLAIMADDVFATLSQQNLPMRVVARDGRRIVIGKPTAP
jgi:4-amino-4-deoxy-L-arabinose transferase-like glycosyltransferase